MGDRTKKIGAAFCGAVWIVAGAYGCGAEQLMPVPGWDEEESSTEESLSWYFGTDMSTAVVKQIQSDYLAETGIWIEWINSDDITLEGVFASGNPPDLFNLTVFDGISNWKDRLYVLSDQTWTDEVYDISLKAAMVEGEVYAMPISCEAGGIIYNKELFRQAGIEKLPQTVSELREVCQILDQAGIQAFGECYQLPGFAEHTLAALFSSESDLDAFVKEMKEGRKTIADMEYYDQWLEVFDLMAEYGIGAKASYYSVDDQIADFAAGRMAMIKQGTWLMPMILRENPAISMGLMPIPCTENADECKLSIVTTNFIGINKDSGRIKTALSFLDWLQKHAVQYFSDSFEVCFYDRSNQTAVGNISIKEYIQEGQYSDHFKSFSWPSGYDNDILHIFQQYLSGTMNREDIADRLTDAFLARAG